ncbi:MAG: bifunctional transaldolase/phosoglucose isomerase [Blastocatellia bacterium]
MNPLVELQTHGQSIWYDNMRRLLLDNGYLQGLITNDDLRGVTSNPAIFEKAIAGSNDYTAAMQQLAAAGKSVQDIYEALAIEDIQRACDLFLPVYEKTGGTDGYVSLEVSPLLANDTAGTIAEALRLRAEVNRKNVMIKVPATPEGIPAIRALIEEGLSINVTLIFSRESYMQVMAAYINGLEARAAKGLPIDQIASVASFFVSRVDSLVDKQLEKKIAGGANKETLTALMGKAAIANAKLAYQDFKQVFGTDRFAALQAKGARLQRPLWASTGTKNPNYSDVLYLDELIGADTVNTVPPATMDAYRDHGKPALTLETSVDAARQTFAALAAAGIGMEQVTGQLLEEGVKAFADSFETLLGSVRAKRALLVSNLNGRQAAALGEQADAAQAIIKQADKDKWTQRIWNKDASLWKSDEAHQKIIKNALGWVNVPALLNQHAGELESFAREIRDAGFRHVMLLGMGGSSLCPEVFRRTFGRQAGYPELLVLDSTDPATVRAFEAGVDLASTLFVVASKSGSTIEPLMFYRYFFDRVREVKGDRTGENFVAITDPGTLMEKMATDDKFRRIFTNPADIGGRYSALSFFGMVPAALQGVEVGTLLERAEAAMHACGPVIPAADNPGLKLGAALGALARAGRDKLTLFTSPDIASLGLWIEQLIAESTGKEGLGIVPVAGETPGAPAQYGSDRVFVHISVGAMDAGADQSLRALEAAGHPVIRRTLNDALDLGEEFYIWEIATAVAGVVLAIHPFDQPNVQESTDNTGALLDEFRKNNALPEQTLAAKERVLSVYATEDTINQLGRGQDPAAFIAAHLDRAGAGDYIAMLDYIQESDRHEALIQQIRTQLCRAQNVATTTGYGPRFLHSTGQLHKGGADNGVFVQVTADDARDVPLPGEPFTFGILKQAQALGDFKSLASRNRRAIRVHLHGDISSGLQRLLEIIQTAFPLEKSQKG